MFTVFVILLWFGLFSLGGEEEGERDDREELDVEEGGKRRRGCCSCSCVLI